MPYTDSDPVTASITFKGVWMHDDDESLGPQHFPFGANTRDTGVDVMGSGSFYAGRVSPVFEYGEHESTVVNVGIDIPGGEDYQGKLACLEEFARSKKAVWFRDNRGRAVYGVVRNFKHSDEDWGSAVSFTVERVHRTVSTVEA